MILYFHWSGVRNTAAIQPQASKEFSSYFQKQSPNKITKRATPCASRPLNALQTEVAEGHGGGGGRTGDGGLMMELHSTLLLRFKA